MINRLLQLSPDARRLIVLEHLEMMRVATGQRPKIETTKGLEFLDARDLLKFGVLVDILDNVRIARCSDTSWVMGELRKELSIEHKLKLISYALHFQLGSKVTTMFNRQMSHIPAKVDEPIGFFLVKIEHLGQLGAMHIWTNNTVSMDRMLLSLSVLFDQAGIKFQVMASCDYDPVTLLMSRQLFHQDLTEYVENKRVSGSEESCYSISIKFSNNTNSEHIQTFLRGFKKILDKVRMIEEPVCHFDNLEIRVGIFGDPERLRTLYQAIQKIKINSLKISREALRETLGSLEINPYFVSVSTSGDLVFDRIDVL